MRNVVALTQRELAANFLSPVAYIVALAFLVASGHFFLADTLVPGREASLRPMFDSMAQILVFAIPLLTMRVLSEEFSTGTIETLMTAPVSDIEVVTSKFLGVLLFYASLLLTTLIHVGLLIYFGGGDFPAILLAYAGMLLLGALFVAVGVFSSSVTRYQLLAALLGMGILSILTFVVDQLGRWRGGAWRTVLSYVNVLGQFEDFSKGLFDSSAIVFFITGTLFFLFLAVKSLESHRWR
ncbi:MAG: ABC transporter permease [Phycisphaerae bacterium]|nr:ABC transporter permease [Phycisphaerae bacterium]